jgi:hypothetical protein
VKKMLKAKELEDGGNSSARNHAYDINFLEGKMDRKMPAPIRPVLLIVGKSSAQHYGTYRTAQN